MARKPAPKPGPPRAAAAILAVAALAAFIALALGDLLTASPTSDETAHLAAGYSYLVTHDYRLNPEHPPLVKMLAALPLLGMRVWPAGFRDAGDGTRAFAYFREAWAMSIANPAFSEWRVAQLLLYGLRDRLDVDPLDAPTTVSYARGDFLNDADAMFRRARVMMLLLGAAPAVLLAPIVVIVTVWLIVRDRTSAKPLLAALAGAAVASVVIIWAVYGFRQSAAADPAAARAEEITARATLRQRVLDAPDVWPT